MLQKILGLSTAIILASCLIESNNYLAAAGNVEGKIAEFHHSYQIAQTRSYRVRLGDTLGGIANRFGMSLNQILNYNSHLRSRPNLIYVGENINLERSSTSARAPSPSGNKYTVRRGDTLGGIAIRHGLRFNQILAYNPQIVDPNIIQVNQKINVGSAIIRRTPSPIPPTPRKPSPNPNQPTQPAPSPISEPEAPRRAVAFESLPQERRPGSNSMGAIRGDKNEACTKAGENMRAIAPANGLGYTFDDYPYFFWYFPGIESDSIPVEFTLLGQETKEINGKMRTRPVKIYEQKLNLDQPGIIAFQLPRESQRLQEGQEYKWRIEIQCTDKTAMFLKYSIKRLSTDNPELTSKLENTPVDRHPVIFAESGVWFDALKLIALQLEQAPRESILKEDWNTVLKEIGFEDLIGEPIQYIGSNIE